MPGVTQPYAFVSCIILSSVRSDDMQIRAMFNYKVVSGENRVKPLQLQNIYFLFVHTKLINKIHFYVCQNAI